MKLEKKHYVIIAVIIVIIVIWYFSKKKKAESDFGLSRDFDASGSVPMEDSAWWIFGKKPIQVTTPESTASKCVNCWVTTFEDGVEYCRWYDNYGRNTQSYAGRGCTGGQANMGGVNQGYGSGYGKKKSWWETLFGG